MWSATLPWTRHLSPLSLLEEINRAFLVELEIMQQPHHVAYFATVCILNCIFNN